MNKPNFKQHEPLELHSCLHCQHTIHDIQKGKVCKMGEFVLTHMEYISMNDCVHFLSEYITDHYQHKGDGVSILYSPDGILTKELQ